MIASFILLVLGAYSTAIGTPLGKHYVQNISIKIVVKIIIKGKMLNLLLNTIKNILGFGIDRPSRYINVETFLSKQVL